MLHQCDICGKTLSRKEHLHSHMKNVHGEGNSVQSIAIPSNLSTTDDDIYTDDEMEGQSDESYTDEETGEETEEESSENSNESEEEDNNPWKLILNDVFQKMDPIRASMIERGVSTERFENIRYYIRNVNLKSTSTCSYNLILSKNI